MHVSDRVIQELIELRADVGVLQAGSAHHSTQIDILQQSHALEGEGVGMGLEEAFAPPSAPFDALKSELEALKERVAALERERTEDTLSEGSSADESKTIGVIRRQERIAHG